MQAVAPSLRMELTPIDVRQPGEIERGITEFARAANGGLIAPASPSQGAHRKLIITLATRHRLPAVYPRHHRAHRYVGHQCGALRHRKGAGATAARESCWDSPAWPHQPGARPV